MINVDEVKARVREIRSYRSRQATDSLSKKRRRIWDSEQAHIFEDKLYAEVLKAISAGSKEHRRLASEALKTKRMKFARWVS